MFQIRNIILILYETKYLNLKTVKRDNKPDWVYVMRPNAKNVVAILPLIKKEDEDEILFLITKRPPLENESVAEFCVEIPAGLVGDENENETTMESIKKELLEETGLVAEKIEILNEKVSTSAGLTSETVTTALAYITDDKIKMTPVDDNGVIVDRIRVKKSEIKSFLKEKEGKGYAISSLLFAPLFYV